MKKTTQSVILAGLTACALSFGINGSVLAGGGHEVIIYNDYGYDTHGYNAHGYNSHGYNSHGYNIHGYNSHGYNAHGYNSHGYNIHGVYNGHYNSHH